MPDKKTPKKRATKATPAVKVASSAKNAAPAAAAAPEPGDVKVGTPVPAGRAAVTTDGPLRCPRCAASMREFDHLGVTLDGCVGCGGVFFDAGELEQVLQREYPEAMAAAADFYESQISLEAGEPAAGGVAAAANMGSFFRSLFKRLKEGEV